MTEAEWLTCTDPNKMFGLFIDSNTTSIGNCCFQAVPFFSESGI